MITKLRGLLPAVLLGLLVLLPAPALAAPEPVAAVSVVLTQDPPPGPVLDPAESDRANNEKTKNQLIAGGTAVVLLGIVLWGRRVRAKRRKSG
ncbi:hypothetical protein [Amycolatopsis magusensis]|uniref:LPXTG-motif cell wall anchor domain-containing protein n=1 Tax=Amycolatopsis magusensis TaxID=882444 RepID=A0ABS4PML9_9PSEU|nr:hypothetical protein [Amycolatopsis magusensis]MBP2180675.1 hypothetical protein [Amycolatopsis magusensis]